MSGALYRFETTRRDNERTARMAEEIRRGLSSRPRRLPSKYFYDDRGSRLFEEITALPEYYLTRTEERLLAAIAGEVVDRVRPTVGDAFGRENLASRDHRQQCDAAVDRSVHALAGEVPRESEKALDLDTPEVIFIIEAPAAKDIHVAGDFNSWKINDESRVAFHEKGRWEKRVRLPHGRYRYKFFVDGEWSLDSNNQEREQNAFGTFDSILNI